jgi:hypothetical protein
VKEKIKEGNEDVKYYLRGSSKDRSPRYGRANKIEKRQNITQLRIATVNEGQIVGFEDASNSRNYTTSLKCTSLTGTLYVCKTQEFMIKMKHNDRTWLKLQAWVQ